MTEGGNISFELHTINLGKNIHEKIITTCVMMESDLPAEDDFDDLPDLNDREYIALGVLDENMDASQKIKFSEFKAKLMATEGFFEGQKRKSFLKAVSRVVDKLGDKGLIEFDKENQLIKRLGDKGDNGGDT